MAEPTSSVTLTMEAGEIQYFAIFVLGLGSIEFDPAQRIFVQFQIPWFGTLRVVGETSVPVRTHTPACAE